MGGSTDSNKMTPEVAAKYPAVIFALVVVGLGNFAIAILCLRLATADRPLNYALAAVGGAVGVYMHYRMHLACGDCKSGVQRTLTENCVAGCRLFRLLECPAGGKWTVKILGHMWSGSMQTQELFGVVVRHARSGNRGFMVRGIWHTLSGECCAGVARTVADKGPFFWWLTFHLHWGKLTRWR